jgi:hypothetical protein
VSDPPLVVPTEELFPQEVSDALHESFHQFVRGYRHSLQTDRRLLLEEFQFVQIAREVVGVGSVGTRAWILLMVGLGNEDPLFLQAKEAEASVLEEFVGKSVTSTTGLGWWPVNTWCRRPATSSWATNRSKVLSV